MKQTCLVNAKEDKKGIAGQARNDRSFRMKNNVNSLQKLTLFCYVILITLIIACSQSQTPDVKIDYGIATVNGKITGIIPTEIKEIPIDITLVYYSPITGRNEYETKLNENGTFIFEIPISCAGIAHITSRIYEGGICLVPRKKTKLEISFSESGEKQVKMKSSLDFTTEDMENLDDVLIAIYFMPAETNYDAALKMQPETYSKKIMSFMEERLEIVNTHSELSENAKQFVRNALKQSYLNMNLLDYEETMSIFYRNRQRSIHAAIDENFTPLKPEISYYSFLKYFDLNNPQYLYCGYYSMVLQTILANETLNIPSIGDTPIEDWLQAVKVILSDLIGSDTGIFYDILVANDYVKQLNEDAKPLSDKQKTNIKKYFKNKSFVDILFAENKKLIKAIEESHKLINETPIVSNGETIMDAIISKHKGKVVLVDFWATWCGPCLSAMKEMNGFKEEMKNKNVVFVYITDSSSPRGTWEKKVNEIGGEHYYLTQKEWEYISNDFEFHSIPTYLFYNANGVLKNKQTGYPGNEEMRKMIEELLP
jgi:thiol-disulfide isomerase/thioredoxin